METLRTALAAMITLVLTWGLLLLVINLVQHIAVGWL